MARQQQPVAAAASSSTARCIFDPEELRAAAESEFESFLPITLHMVGSEEDTHHIINAGFKEHTSLQKHNTRESGLSNLPSPTSTISYSPTPRSPPRLHELPAPTGAVNCLPTGMPPICNEGIGSMADRVIEIYAR